ncbi:MAG: bifunctional folylpolyglutamate synthase/dihydrofolate synthase, partial [Paludibacteraceae bacterium]|nr:bifunctional folylpolyglutamate synthase/dihydrofolate synthase [Paludibacteraceae bacterium]
MTYEETLQFIYNRLPLFQVVGSSAYKVGLESMEKFDERLGHPHQAFKTIHVGGTNGKGSVSHTIASVLQSAGYKVGLFTSPHL